MFAFNPSSNQNAFYLKLCFPTECMLSDSTYPKMLLTMWRFCRKALRHIRPITIYQKILSEAVSPRHSGIYIGQYFTGFLKSPIGLQTASPDFEL